MPASQLDINHSSVFRLDIIKIAHGAEGASGESARLGSWDAARIDRCFWVGNGAFQVVPSYIVLRKMPQLSPTGAPSNGLRGSGASSKPPDAVAEHAKVDSNAQ